MVGTAVSFLKVLVASPTRITSYNVCYTKLLRAGPGEQVTDLGVKACLEALGGLDPAELDLVVYCGSEYKDYYLFNAAAAVARRIGAVNANAFEIHNLCSAGVWSLKVLAGLY